MSGSDNKRRVWRALSQFYVMSTAFRDKGAPPCLLNLLRTVPVRVKHECSRQHTHLGDLSRLVLLQLLLEATVGADKGANSLDCRQTFLPAVVSDSHEVGHHHGRAAGHSREAARHQKKHTAR